MEKLLPEASSTDSRNQIHSQVLAGDQVARMGKAAGSRGALGRRGWPEEHREGANLTAKRRKSCFEE